MASIDFSTDLHDAVGAWTESFISETSLTRYRRACAWTASEVAKVACQGATEAIDDPTPWMRRAFGYTRALNRSGDAVQADLFTRPEQSIVMKYGLGDGRQTRRPGDVGLARDRVYVPHWRNLALTQGINRNQYGNLPGGVAARLAREAAGTRAKRRVASRWGVYRMRALREVGDGMACRICGHVSHREGGRVSEEESVEERNGGPTPKDNGRSATFHLI